MIDTVYFVFEKDTNDKNRSPIRSILECFVNNLSVNNSQKL